MASLIPETAQKVAFTAETLRSLAKQSDGIHLIPLRLRRAIKRYIREKEQPHMRRSVLRLSESFNKIKQANNQLVTTTSNELIQDSMGKSIDRAQRWKICTSYGDTGLKYRDDETVAYVASRMPSVYSACYRVLKEVRRRLPGFAPTSVVDFGSGTGSAMWAIREVWPHSLKKINFVEPSKSMQRACQSLFQGQKDLPLIHSYDSIQALSKNLQKSDREHDLVIASYVLGEVPSLKDRITVVRQLWDLTRDVLVLVEPGTPQGFNIISRMRSYILWMEKRKCRKFDALDHTCKDLVSTKCGAFVVAPCAHDGACPLAKGGKYCHFVQRLERTSTQRSYKKSKGQQQLRGFEDEKFCYVVLRKGQRPRQVPLSQNPWPLDGMKFDTLKEQLAKRNPEDLVIDYEDLIKHGYGNPVISSCEEEDPVSYASDLTETDALIEVNEESEEEEEEEDGVGQADLGSGWGRIIFSPVRRGKHVTIDVCRSTKSDGSEGAYERMIITKSDNPTLHGQARKSLWGDLWPY
ncbi:hypothetical protein GIB67_033377 [Kingdonia uniflora]|uniref:Methyltransferase-like protein 17, mitochondrial n=1 Tax=Kingdonia uniflora TaxID=39325 RepID=A0A7J7LTY9_9MAGN|nr:hypothetical protein GIB67_033377 [Kingdonia uniflora]